MLLHEAKAFSFVDSLHKFFSENRSVGIARKIEKIIACVGRWQKIVTHIVHRLKNQLRYLNEWNVVNW